MALKVGELFAEFNIDTSGVDSAVKSAESKLSSLGKGLMAGGAGLTAAVTVPIVKAFKGIYDSGSGFEKQMSRVFAIRGLSTEIEGGSEAMKALEDEAMRMAAQTKYTTEEAGQAFEYMAMAGWDVNNMLAGLEPIMNLAIASGNDLAAVSDIVTDAMTAFGLSADGVTRVMKDGKWMDVNNVQHFSDVLAAVSTNANTNVEIMGETFKYISAQAGAMGYSIDDMAIAIGLMANAGVKGSQAGTSLKNLLTNLAKPSSQAAAAMEELGIKLDDGKGHMLPFRELLANIREGFGGLKVSTEELTREQAKLDKELAEGKITQSDYDKAVQRMMERAYGAEGALKAEAAAAIAGKYGMAGLLALIGASDADVEKLTKEIDNCTGATSQMASTMKDNVAGAFAELQSAINVVETKLFKLEKGALTGLIEKATSAVNAFGGMNEETQRGALRMAGLAAAVGPVMLKSGALLSIMPKLGKSILKLSGPAGLITLGLVAMGAAAMDSGNTIGKTFETMMEAAGTQIEGIGKKLKSGKSGLEKNMSLFLGSIRRGIQYNLPQIARGAGDIISTLVGALADEMPEIGETARTMLKYIGKGIGDQMPTLVPAIAQLIVNIAAEIIKGVPTLLEAGIKIFQGVADGINEIDWEAAGKTIHEAVKTGLGNLKNDLYKLIFGDTYSFDRSTGKGANNFYDMGEQAAQNLIDGMQSISANTKDLIGGLILGEEYKPDDDWAAVGGKIINKVLDGIQDAVDSSSEFTLGFLEGIGGLFSEKNIGESTSAAKDIAEKLITSIMNEIPKLAERAGDILKAIGELIFGKEGENGLAQSAVTGAGLLAQSILNAVTQGLPQVKEAGGLIIGALADVFSADKIDSMKNSLHKFIGNVLGAIINIIPELGSTASGIITALGEALFGKDENGKAIVPKAIDSLTELVRQVLTTVSEQAIPALGSAFSSIFDAMAGLLSPDNIGEVLDSLKGLAEAIIGGITDLFDNENADTLLGSLKTLLEAAIGGLVDVIPELTGEIISLADQIVSVLFSVDESKDGSVVNTTLTSLETLAVSLLNGVSQLFSKENIDSVTTAMTDLVGDILTGVANGIVSAGSTAANILSALGTALFGSGTGEGDGFVSFGVTALQGLMETIFNSLQKEVIPGMGTFAKNIFDAFVGLLSGENIGNITTGLTTLATTLITGIADTITTYVDMLTGYWEHAGETLEGNDALNAITSGLSGMAESIVGALAEAIPQVTQAGSRLIGAFTKLFDKEHIGDVSDALQGILEAVIDGLATVVPEVIGGIGTLLSAIGSALFAPDGEGGKGLVASAAEGVSDLAQALADALVSGFDTLASSGTAGAFIDTAMSLVNGIVDAIPHLVDGLGNVVNAGAKIAGKIMEAISGALGNLQASGLGTQLGQAATDIVHGILTNITNFAENDDVKKFMENLGEGIRSTVNLLGDVIGKIVEYILSPDGARTIFNAGISIVKLIWGGIKSVAENILGGFGDLLLKWIVDPVSNWLDQKLVDLGIITIEDADYTIEIGDNVFDIGMVQFHDSDADKAKAVLAAAIANRTTDGLDKYINSDIQASLSGLFADKNVNYGDFGGWLNKLWGATILKAGNDASSIKNLWEERFSKELGIDISAVVGDSFYKAIAESAKMDENGRWTYNTDTVWSMLYDLLFGGNKEQMEQGTEETKNEINEYAEGFAAACEEAGVDITGSAAELSADVNQAKQTVADAMDQSGSDFGKKGMATALADGTQEVTEAAYQMSDAAVQEFLMTMSEENGQNIGFTFVGGVIKGMDNQRGPTGNTAKAVGASALAALHNAASSGLGYSIGSNFGQGFINGIRARIHEAAAAAAELGSAAGNSLSDSTREGSPSKWTAEIGRNFDLGFINSITALTRDAEYAASGLGLAAGNALAYSARDMGNSALDQTYIPDRRTAAATYYGGQGGTVNESLLNRYNTMITDAISKIRLYMNEREVGEAVAPTVSGYIAHGAASRR